MEKKRVTLQSVAVQVYSLVADASPYPDSILEDFQAVAESSCALLSGEESEMDVDGEE